MFDYVFLYGLFGFGKIIFVFIVVNEMGVELCMIFGFVIERSGDLVVILMVLELGDVLFIDEIYRFYRLIEEVLYFVMEDFCLDIVIGKGFFVCLVWFDFFFFMLVGVMMRVGFLMLLLRD